MIVTLTIETYFDKSACKLMWWLLKHLCVVYINIYILSAKSSKVSDNVFKMQGLLLYWVIKVDRNYVRNKLKSLFYSSSTACYYLNQMVKRLDFSRFSGSVEGMSLNMYIGIENIETKSLKVWPSLHDTSTFTSCNSYLVSPKLIQFKKEK